MIERIKRIVDKRVGFFIHEKRMNTLLGTKLDMTSRFDKNGKRLTITRVKVGKNVVVEKKSTEKAGYNGVVLGYGNRRKATKALLTKLTGIGSIPKYIKEIRSDEAIDVGARLSIADVFAVGDLVKVTGESKGKGFTGVVKRYNFRGGPKTHGQSDRHRARGSLGSGTTPGRVFKGKRMAGRSGGETQTVRNLVVAYITPDGDEMLLTGPIPGSRNSMITITKIGENKKFPGIEELTADMVTTPIVEEVSAETDEVVSPETIVDAVEVVTEAPVDVEKPEVVNEESK
jgi:large subunit ribosomal protein L3